MGGARRLFRDATRRGIRAAAPLLNGHCGARLSRPRRLPDRTCLVQGRRDWRGGEQLTGAPRRPATLCRVPHVAGEDGACQGRLARSTDRGRRAQDSNPSLTFGANVGPILDRMRDYDAASVQLEPSVEVAPSFRRQIHLA